jgi:tetratricopeptide (TPR) repeat protein
MSEPPLPASPPDWVEDLFRQAEAARKGGSHALALAIYQRIVAARPNHLTALHNLGALCTVLGRRAEAEAVLRQVLAQRPDDARTRHALGMTLMAQGRYPEAWPYYEARFEIPQLGLRKPAMPYPEWRGEDLTGRRLLIFSEMGFGDQIQHARFAAVLRDRGVAVTLACRPGLARLLADSLPGVEVLAIDGELRLPPQDCWTTSGALMGLLGVTPETLPAAPYLRAPASHAPPPAGFKVGLKTAGDRSHGNDAWRSLSTAEAEALRASLPGQVVDLSPEATGAADFAETAALVGQLDLVVSVDTSVAHLAGALGKRGFVLIPAFNTDWRWMHERTDSPWYPSLSLYRADPKAGWGPALDRLARDAAALAAAS